MFKMLSPDQLPDKAEFQSMRLNAGDLCLINENSNAYCSLWWQNVPELPGSQPGLIGHFFAENAEEARGLLELACKTLKEHECNLAIGPIDGNTWKPYRLVSWSGNDNPFLMEPTNPAEWPEFWQNSEFEPFHEYLSSITDDLSSSDPRLPRTRTRLEANGITWRSINPSEFEKDLRSVFKLSLEAFSKNILYTPLAEDEFINQYLPYAQKIDSELVLLAENAQGDCCGFIFAIPDFTQLQRGETLTRLIIKTLAVSSARRSAGLGSVLVDEVQKRAAKKGLTQAIHALMHSENASANIGKNSRLIRKYTLYKREL